MRQRDVPFRQAIELYEFVCAQMSAIWHERQVKRSNRVLRLMYHWQRVAIRQRAATVLREMISVADSVYGMSVGYHFSVAQRMGKRTGERMIRASRLLHHWADAIEAGRLDWAIGVER